MCITSPSAKGPLTYSPLDYVTLLPRLLPPSIASPLLTLVTTLFGITHGGHQMSLNIAAGLGLIGLWVYNRGVDGFVQDVQDLAARWAGEYEKYSGEVKKYQQDQEAQIRMQAKQQGGRGWR